ncbi:hypothetical protein CEUSTIGMA_g8630.t1 [Chlamydomonas eustigma]|uniref:Sel1 repeat family protein n=1 Tax=Chlamydomonas eustigma TaxID=1157962 RepID=A0A250XDN6_9CHLO|nr:hypothetical protein CEUSTIGMA_g8630.t1 [Chlamydomonas eustigma]|eukprot:GAX81197.1 hypothetical protein CEUSTIGMA_g8630.t1 [Chlamydomonas eustigma]
MTAAALTCSAIVVLMFPHVLRGRGRSAQKENVVHSLHLDEDGSSPNPSEDVVRIPLSEVVRFKEQQWFVEELEGARDGDPNAMLRLAKMYLHGQGCEKNGTMAHEWLRKARYLGVPCSLEELYAGDDWQAERARAAAEERRALKGRRP